MKKQLLALALLASAPFALASPYIGGGYSQLYVSTGDFNDGIDMGTLHLQGGYQFNDFFALEARVGMGVSGATFAGIDHDVDTYYAGFVKIGAPLDNFYPYLLVGYSQGTIETEKNGVRSEWKESDMAYGLGLGYKVMPNLTVQLEYNNLLSKGDLTIIGFSAGLTYHFE